MFPNGRQIYRLFGTICGWFGLKGSRNFMKEVVTQNHGNAPKQIQIDVFFLEYLVDIRTGTTQLGGKPSDGSSLVVKCAFYELADMNHAVCVPVSSPDSHWREVIKPSDTYKRERGNPTFAHPVSQGLRNAHPRERATQKAPRRYAHERLSAHECTHHMRTSSLRIVVSGSIKVCEVLKHERQTP